MQSLEGSKGWSLRKHKPISRARSPEGYTYPFVSSWTNGSEGVTGMIQQIPKLQGKVIETKVCHLRLAPLAEEA